MDAAATRPLGARHEKTLPQVRINQKQRSTSARTGRIPHARHVRPAGTNTMRKEIKVAESMSETATLGLNADQVEFFKENGFIGPFDLYSEEEAPLIWNQGMIEMVKSKN